MRLLSAFLVRHHKRQPQWSHDCLSGGLRTFHHSAQRGVSNPEAVQNLHHPSNAVQSSIRSECYCSHPPTFRHNRAGNLLCMDESMSPAATGKCVFYQVTVYPTICALGISATLRSVHRPLNIEPSSLSPLTKSGPTASEDRLSRIRGGSSKASPVFCSFSVTRDQLLLELFALAHSSLLTQPNE